MKELLLKFIVYVSLILFFLSSLALANGDCEYEAQMFIVWVITAVINFSAIAYNNYVEG